MANLVIAEVCNLSCDYCFASEQMQAAKASSTPVFISLEAFEDRLDLLERLGVHDVRLIGGEPTLHPQFPELIRRARQRGNKIAVFSNGLLSKKALGCLKALPADECTVLVNMNAARGQEQMNVRQQAQRRAVLHQLGTRVLVGYNISKVDFDPSFLFPLILEANCRKSIRLGLAQPTLSGHNTYLHPKLYPIVGRKIVHFAQIAQQFGIVLEFDCGFVRCMFSEIELEQLQRAQVKVGWRCGPIPDIDLNGQAVHCFPLADKITSPIGCIISINELIATLEAQIQPYHVAGIYKECSDCHFKHNNECKGGCRANTLLRFRHSTIRMSVPKQVFVLGKRANFEG
jgi:radical SAM protein with 4Fe4S-binding SPASM domain